MWNELIAAIAMGAALMIPIGLAERRTRIEDSVRRHPANGVER